MSQKRKVTLYFNAGMLADTQREALRQDRSISWIIQAAWRIARDEMKRMPAAIPQQASPDSVEPQLPDATTGNALPHGQA